MSVFIVNWNPSKWKMDDEAFDEAVAVTANGGEWGEQWSVGGRVSGIGWGDRAYLLRQHRDRGVVATGYFTSEIYQDAHWDGSDQLANYAAISWTTWLPLDDRLRTEELAVEVPGVSWRYLQGSGVAVRPNDARDLDALWERHLESLGRDVTDSPEELAGSETYHEGAVKRVPVNRYERDRRARDACINHYGTTCTVCGFDFAATYGTLGDGYAHVHHLTDLSLVGDDYKLDPIKDLRPVCPNCHAMLHRQRPALSIAALRTHLQ